MIVTISGLSGSGKSTAAKAVAHALGVPTVDIGKVFRSLAKRYGMDVAEFGAYAERHPEIDRELDEAMIRKAKRAGDLILQGRLAGWMTLRHGIEAYRIWLSAAPQTRASRIAGREGVPYRDSLRATTARDKANRARYARTYGLDLNDLSIYDSVVRTDNLSVEEVVDLIIGKLAKVWRKKRRQTKSRKLRTAPLHRSRRPQKGPKRRK